MIEESKTNMLHNTAPREDYIFSYTNKVSGQRVVRRPWWKFWAQDTVVPTEYPMRHVHVLTKDEGEFVMYYWNASDAGMRVMKKLLGDPVDMQLEYGKPASPYTPTTTVKP